MQSELIDILGRMWYNRAVPGSNVAPLVFALRLFCPSPIVLFRIIWYNETKL